MGWPFRPDLLHVTLERFRLQHPTIGVQFHEVLENYRTRLEEMLYSDAVPNVVQVREGQAGAWWAGGLIRPLEQLTAFADLAARLRPAARAGVGPGNALAGLPFYSDVMVLAYNAAMLEDLGGRPPETWEELGAYGRELRERGIAKTPISLNFAPKVNANLPWWGMVYAAGGRMLAADQGEVGSDDPAVRMLEALRRFLVEDLTLEPELGETTYEQIVLGQHAFAVTGTYMARQFAQARVERGGPSLLMAPLPGLDRPGTATVSWTPFYAVGAGAADPEPSALLALHLGGIDAGGEFYSPAFWAQQQGLPPGYPEVMAMPETRDVMGQWIDVGFLERVLSMGRPVEGLWEPWFETWEHWSRDEVMRALWGTATPLESMQSIARIAGTLRDQVSAGQ